MRQVGLDYITLDAGLLWQATPDTTIGLMAKNLVDLHKSGFVRTTTEKIFQSRFSMPLIFTLAVAVTKDTWLFTCDQEIIRDHFGGLEKKTAEFWLVRAGIEKRLQDNTFLRAGLIIPVVARTSSLGNIRNDLPNPKFGATIGAGVNFRHFKFDLAITGNPGRSYIEQKIYLQAVASISLML